MEWKPGFSSTQSVFYQASEDCFSSVQRQIVSGKSSLEAGSSRTVTATLTYLTKYVSVKQSGNGKLKHGSRDVRFAMEDQNDLRKSPSKSSPTLHLNGVKSHNTLVFKDGNLVSVSLEDLINGVVPTADSFPEKKYLFAFLLSSRLFIKPYELLQEIHHRWLLLQQSCTQEEKFQKSCTNFIRFLSEWTENYPYDFRDEKMMRLFKKVTHRCLQIDHRLKKMIAQIMHTLLNKLSEQELYEESLNNFSIQTVSSPINGSKNDIVEVCASPSTVALLLTRLELEKLRQIGPEEFIEALVQQTSNSQMVNVKKAKNLNFYVQFFNRISYLVATEICAHVKKKQRVRVIEYLTEVACECFNRGNFNSTMAIISGMSLSSVVRLKKTWGKVDKEKLEILQHQMDPTSNFANYRSTLKAAEWRRDGATDEKEKLIIPFFSLLMKDLYFLNEKSTNCVSNEHINFDKFLLMAKQITKVMKWQNVICTIEVEQRVSQYLHTANVYSEIELALASFECEPPDSNLEKEMLKNLKWK